MHIAHDLASLLNLIYVIGGCWLFSICNETLNIAGEYKQNSCFIEFFHFKNCISRVYKKLVKKKKWQKNFASKCYQVCQ